MEGAEMIYVVDTCVFRHIISHVYRSVLPEVWESLEDMLSLGEVISVKESYKELELQFSKDGKVMKWLRHYRDSFKVLTNEEAIIVSQIYAYRNFQYGVKEKCIINGMPVADAFIVAKAKCVQGIVVTRETFSPTSAKIPNICESFDVPYIGEEEFQLILKNRKKNLIKA